MENSLNDDIKCPHCGETIKADVEQKKYKQLYDRYNQCRDAELDRFWKNSTFVWVMMALCYTAFGLLLSKYYGFDSKPSESRDFDDNMKDKFEIAFAIISIFGLLLSTIWIWMAQGLKAWYEVYEGAIWDIEEKDNILKFDKKYTIENYWSVKNGWSPFKAKRLSPSKIVIFIGILMDIFWFISLSVCLYKYYGCDFIKYEWFKPDFVTKHNNWSFGIIITIIIGVIYVTSHFIRSSALRDCKEEKIYQYVRNDNKIRKYEEYAYIFPYYEVKNNMVSFIHSNIEQFEKGKRFLSDYYRTESENNKAELKINFPIKKIKQYYNNDNQNQTDAEKEITEYITHIDSSLKLDTIRVYDSTISVYFDGSNYKNDMQKITNVFDKLMKDKTKYSKFKVLYSFKESKDEN